MRAILLPGCLALAAALPAADEKIDLKRVTPVPADQPIPVMDYFRAPLMQGPRLSRDGTHVAAFISTERDSYHLIVHNPATSEARRINIDDERDIYSFTWLTDSHLIFSLAHDKLRTDAMLVAQIGRRVAVHPVMRGNGASVLAVPEARPEFPLVWIWSDMERNYDDTGVIELHALLDTGPLGMVGVPTAASQQSDVRELNRNHALRSYPVPRGGKAVYYLPDKWGELAFCVTHRDGYYTLHHLSNGQWEASPADLDVIDVLGFGERPGEVVVLGPRATGKPRPLQFMEASTGTLGDVILADPGYDFDGSIYRHPTKRDVLGVSIDRAGPGMVWFTEDYKALQKILEGYFPGRQVRIIDIARSEKQCLVTVFSDRHPASYYRVDFEKRSLELVKDSRPWIDPERMRPMSIMKYKTRDGRQLDAYVTLPAGTTKENPAPLVVMPHGGPWVRDTWGFDSRAQFLASRGYAVLQPNYRGSPGYDWLFPEEDRWEFRKMHEDVTDATRAVFRTGMIDRQRVAIFGSSFGGYLALCGVAFEPELYRCAVTFAGVFDWAATIRDAKFSQHTNSEYAVLLRRLGDPKQQEEKFAAISPLKSVDQIKVPVFVAHGKEDSVVSVAESRRLVVELKRLRVPHEVMLMSEEGHGVARIRTEVQLYSRIESFLNEHLAAR